MNPACTTSGGTGCEAPPEELILALNVYPSATETTQFSDAVVYHIYFENDVGVASQIDCSISAGQIITCAGLIGLSVSAPVDEIGVNGDIEAALMAIDNADSITGNSFSPPSELAALMADDRLKVDLEWSACLGVWGLELSMLAAQPNTNDCGGRMLDCDYLEEFLSMTISGCLTPHFYNPYK